MTRIREVAEYKKGVKGTTKKAVKEIATLAESAVRIKSQSEEVRSLQMSNDKLKREIDALKNELEDLKKQVDARDTVPNMVEMKRRNGLSRTKSSISISR